jgi:hypothetical protein
MRIHSRFRSRRWGVLLCLLLPVLAAASPSNKWRIQVSSDADSDGVVVLRVIPQGGVPLDVTVQLAKDIGENGVARRIRDALRTQLGKGYQVEVDDGEDVLLKRRGDTPVFELQLLEKTVDGLRISLDRE